MKRALLAPLVFAVGATIAVAAWNAPAGATAPSRAVVVVDAGDGGGAHVVKISFDGDSITGIEALRRAGFDPAVRGFGGVGGAVCAQTVAGSVIGCPTDQSCFTCASPKYWAYFRAPAGAAAYRYQALGAGSVAVRDGDVEAWKWGTGGPPEYVGFASVWAVTTTTTTAAERVPVRGAGVASTTAVPTRLPATPTTGAGPPVTSGVAGAPAVASRATSTTATTAGARRGDVARAAGAAGTAAAKAEQGSPARLLALAAVLALLLGWIVLARVRGRAA